MFILRGYVAGFPPFICPFKNADAGQPGANGFDLSSYDSALPAVFDMCGTACLRDDQRLFIFFGNSGHSFYTYFSLGKRKIGLLPGAAAIVET